MKPPVKLFPTPGPPVGGFLVSSLSDNTSESVGAGSCTTRTAAGRMRESCFSHAHERGLSPQH